MKQNILLVTGLLFLASFAGQPWAVPAEIPALTQTENQPSTDMTSEPAPAGMVLIPAGTFTMGSNQETALND